MHDTYDDQLYADIAISQCTSIDNAALCIVQGTGQLSIDTTHCSIGRSCGRNNCSSSSANTVIKAGKSCISIEEYTPCTPSHLFSWTTLTPDFMLCCGLLICMA